MVSTERWARSSSSPSSSGCSSHVGSWERYQDRNVVLVGENGNNADLSTEDVREVARRVLEDLEELCLDHEDEESEDDQFDSGSEWGFEMSSRNQPRERRAGGMTLEELTVAVNASIRYHCPTRSNVGGAPVQRSRGKVNKSFSRHTESCNSQPRPRRQQKETRESRQPKEMIIGVFQEMLERKERQFYTRQSEDIVGHSNIEPLQTPEPPVIPIATINQQQQTMMAYVKDQATEMENFSPLPVTPAPLIVMEDLLPTQSLSLRVNEVYPTPREKPLEFYAVGPTLADVERCRPKREKDRLSSLSFSASEFSMQSSSSSSASSAKPASSLSSSSSINQSIDSNNSSSDSHNSRRSGGQRSIRSSKPSRCSKISTKYSKNEEYLQASCTRLVSPVQRTQERIWQATSTSGITPEEASVPLQLSPNVPQIPSSPALVEWELDLSNFTP